MPDIFSSRRKLSLRWSPLIGRPFEFVTSLSQDECITRLKWKEDRTPGWFRAHHALNISLWQHEGTLYYRLRRSPTPNLTAEVSGQLERLTDGTTRVIGVARIHSTHGWFRLVFFLSALFYIPFVLPLSKVFLLYLFFFLLLV